MIRVCNGRDQRVRNQFNVASMDRIPGQARISGVENERGSLASYAHVIGEKT